MNNTDKLKTHMQEALWLSTLLALWDGISLQGIDPETVDAFLFHKKVNFYDAVRLKDGTVVMLNPKLERVPTPPIQFRG